MPHLCQPVKVLKGVVTPVDCAGNGSRDSSIPAIGPGSCHRGDIDGSLESIPVGIHMRHQSLNEGTGISHDK